jgi:hypothetical protein
MMQVVLQVRIQCRMIDDALGMLVRRSPGVASV